MKTLFIRIATFIISFSVICYLFNPVLNPGYISFWVTLIICLSLAFVPSMNDKKLGRNALIGVSFVSLFIITATGMTWGLFRSHSYYQQLGIEHDGKFNTDLPPIDINEAPLVSRDMAYRSAEKQLASIPSLGSQVNLGTFQKQLIDGKLYWVSFLQHSSFFKWFSTDGTPGYVRVSATDPTDVKLITKINGKKLKLKYLPSSYFNSEIMRHLYLNGYSTDGFATILPEVNDKGYPYYVATLYKNEIGFSGANTTSVVIIDPQTGKTKQYKTGDVPKWVDIIEPAKFMVQQISNRGEFVHGWLNPSDKDKFRISNNPELVYGSNGHAYWYVGLTSVGNDNGLIGFYMINSRTKKVRRFKLSGATESVAEKAAEGVLPEKQYSATPALPFVINGVPTYVFALRDSSGVPRDYAMVNIKTFQVLAVEKTLEATLRQYEFALSNDPTTLKNMPVNIMEEKVSGTIDRFSQTINQGNTAYMLTLKNKPGYIFIGNSSLSNDLPLAKEGDLVEIKYHKNSRSHVYNLIYFHDNAVWQKNVNMDK